MLQRYFIHFAVAHDDFRIPELLSVAKCHGFVVHLPPGAERETHRPIMVVELEDEEHARLLARRCILIKSVYQLWADGKSYEELHEINRNKLKSWESFMNSSWRFIVQAHNHTIPMSRQKEVINSFSYMALTGKIEMKNADLVLGCFEEYGSRGKATKRAKDQGDGEFDHVWFGRLVEDGSARTLIGKFDVKKREYYGNTSMDAEVSLLMANQVLAAPGKLVYDPFAGTGSMLYTAAHFGALVVGSDIDGRQMRGKESSPGILRSAKQYDVGQLVVDCCTFDVTRNPWRCGELFDGIVTDPPYGVRAGAKRLGRKNEAKQRTEPKLLPDGTPSYRKSDYFPPTKPYELSDLASDLVVLARWLLKPGGRLVFFLPTVTDEYADVDIPTCDGMALIANSVQDFGKWGRRLITMEKITEERVSRPLFDSTRSKDVDAPSDEHVPAHRDFRVKYFGGFKKENGVGESAEI